MIKENYFLEKKKIAIHADMNLGQSFAGLSMMRLPCKAKQRNLRANL
jgi:hypothetical protein